MHWHVVRHSAVRASVDDYPSSAGPITIICSRGVVRIGVRLLEASWVLRARDWQLPLCTVRACILWGLSALLVPIVSRVAPLDWRIGRVLIARQAFTVEFWSSFFCHSRLVVSCDAGVLLAAATKLPQGKKRLLSWAVLWGAKLVSRRHVIERLFLLILAALLLQLQLLGGCLLPLFGRYGGC